MSLFGVCYQHSKAARTPAGTSSKFWGQPTVFAQRTHLFLEASKAACFGEQVISLAWHFPKWQLKAELPPIRSSALCLCHQWREYGHQHATHHICKGNSMRGNYRHSQNPYSWEQTHIKSNCELLLEFIWIFFHIVSHFFTSNLNLRFKHCPKYQLRWFMLESVLLVAWERSFKFLIVPTHS